MKLALGACRITIITDYTSNHFSSVVSSLAYQAECFGIAVDFCNTTSSNHLLLHFMVPSLEPLACEISAWSDDKDRRASEDLFQAASGIMSVHGRSKNTTTALGVDYVSTLTSVCALTSLMAAAVGQYRGLDLRTIKLSMSSIALLGVSQYIADASVLSVDDALLPGNEANLWRPPFISSDNILFELETLDAEPWLLFWQQMGVDTQLSGRAWKAFQLRYAKAISPLPAELFALLAQKTYENIRDLAARAGVSISRVVSLAEHSLDPATKSSWENGPWTFNNRKICTADQVKTVSGYLPLSGIKVIESCRRIQGPLAGHLLALLGADVIRIEPPGGDPLRGMPPTVSGCSVRFSALNRLKDVREINIKSADGRLEIFDLVKNSHVFLHNWAPGKDSELGLDHETLAALTPEIIYGCASGWGSHLKDIEIPGTDFMAQAYSGVAAEIADASGSKGGSLFTVLDSLGGAVAAQGIVAALLERQGSNTGCKVETSLLGAAHLLVQKKLKDIYTDNTCFSGKILNSAKIYKTSDGLLALYINNKENKNRLLELLDIKTESSDIELDIVNAFRGDSAKNWQFLLDGAHISATLVTENLQDIKTDQRFQTSVKDSSYLHILSPWSFQ